ncbi:LytR/AlgR family response regulator transcription factor [Dyadobacter pollutisoli]|uniref:LytTR family DNA-binding domain-containing protein n=1 Tax=Dyadobacter pollutisoli TaxID=2910158 RepID=A0A9E8N9Y7_9BACT|nr:LytTR family DNA-binding domain-containing protein [Dyadobacter pollutisoli]WAC10602.1 LytTR family DNA-binding domain-containing protein [Dyadobacter pollutisoli]
MNVLIIEDEALSASRLQNLLYRYDPAIKVLQTLTSIRESIQWLGNTGNVTPDLIFMDLHLEDGLAFKIIDDLHLNVPIVFTTAYSEYTLKAFKANSIDYLLKPIDPGELASAIDKFAITRPKASPVPDMSALLAMYQSTVQEPFKERFLASAGTKLFSIQTTDIAYFTIEQKATFLKTYEGKHLAMDYSLDKLSQLLDPKQFFRINRSLIVALNSIRTIHTISAGRLRLELHPSIGQEVLVSGDRMADFKQWLGK